MSDCLSPTIFNIVVEPLLLKIIHTKNLKGLNLASEQRPTTVPHKTIEYRANSFADDSTVIIKPEERYLRFLINLINSFTSISGLHANLNKTAVIPVGFRQWDNSQIIAPDLGLVWTDSFTLLGYTIDNRLANLNQNISNRIEKIKQLINTWKRRHLSLFGRINVAKGLLVSQLTYQVIVVGAPPPLISQTEELILDFIKGDSKRNWLSKDLICTPKSRFGLGFFYLSHFYSAVQIGFLKHYNVNSEEIWAKVLDNQLGFLPKDRLKLWKIGDIRMKKLAEVCKVQGIKQCLNSLAEFQKIFPTTNFKDNSWFLQPLFNNYNVKSFFSCHHKRKGKKTLHPIHESDIGLKGNCTIYLSKTFFGGKVKTHTEMSKTIKENLFPHPGDNWHLSENSYLRLTNCIKYIVAAANRKTYDGVSLCFPEFQPLVFPKPPKYSYSSTLHMITSIKKGSSLIRKTISRTVNINWSEKVKSFKKSTGILTLTEFDIKNIYCIITKSKLSPLTRERILSLMQRKYIFNAQWEHIEKKPENYAGPQCTLCSLAKIDFPMRETFRHVTSECPVIIDILKELPLLTVSNNNQDTNNPSGAPSLLDEESSTRRDKDITQMSSLGDAPDKLKFPYGNSNIGNSRLDIASPLVGNSVQGLASPAKPDLQQEIILFSLVEILACRMEGSLPTAREILKKLHFHYMSISQSSLKNANKILPLVSFLDDRLGKLVRPPDGDS